MKQQSSYRIALTALFAALSYAVFTFLQIKIPVGTDMTSIHLGNAVVVLAALVIGGPLGGLAGALGMSIGDFFDPVYLPLVPKTFLCKLLIGLITGFLAHRVGRIGHSDDRSHILRWVILSVSLGLLFNVIADPIIGYFYKILILGKPAADVSLRINFLASGINAVVSAIVSTIIYMSLYPVLRKQSLTLTPER